MATVLTFQIRASGGDYTTLSAAISANAKNLVAADESHVFEMYNDWPLGLDDDTPFVGYTTGATNTITITSPESERNDGVDVTTGFHFSDASGILRPISTANHVTVEYIGFKSCVTPLNRQNGGFKNAVIDSCIFDSCSGPGVINFLGAPLGVITRNLSISSSSDSFLSVCEVVGNTIVNSGYRGIVSGGGVVTDNFVFGSSSVDISNQGGTHSNNATGDSTASGVSPYKNRTTGDFADYAAGDYRTSQNSALATAGLNGAIGYATDASGASAPTGIPTIGTITKTETTATIPFSYAEGDEVDGFDLRVGGVTITDEGTDNPIVLTGLTAGTAYTVEVRAYNTTGDGSWSSVVGFTTDSVEHNDVNLSFNVSANIKMSGVKSAADSVELPLAVNVRADGFKESAGSSAFDTATQVAVSGTKHSVGELGILQGLNAILTGVKSAGGNALVTTATHIQTGGIKHSPGQINITAYAIVGWQGSSEVTRLGSITIQAAVGVAFGGIKHANEAVSFNTLASANIKGVKHSSGDINIRAKQYIGINATKSATGIIAFNAAAMIDWAGYSSQTPTRVTLISMHGVVQSLHLNGIKKSINLRGYL